jgi:hypothetical protein
MDTTLLMAPLYGTVVKKIYYDHTLKRPVSKALRIDEFVAPYGATNLDEAPRKTHVMKKTINDIKKMGKRKIWFNTEEIDQASTPVTSESELPAQDQKEVANKATGIEPSHEERDAKRIVLEQHRLWDLDDKGIEKPYCIVVDKETQKVLSVQALTYTDQNGDEKEFNCFVVYNFLPSPDSWMGWGFGHILEHINRAINSLTNQLMDAGTLSNTIGGFINKTRNLKFGKLRMKMGLFTEIDAPTDDIRKSIYEFQFKQPSSVLFALLGMLQDYAQKVSSTPDSLSGEMPSSDTAATAILAVMEQGMKVHSTIHRRQYSSLNEELEKIALINSIYLDNDIYLAVQDSTAPEMQEQEAIDGRSDFNQGLDVYPVADPTITSRAERFIIAQQSLEAGRQSNAISQDAEAMYELEKEYFEAMGIKNVDKIVKPPQPAPQPPDLRPEEEEAEFLAERDVKPLEGQDHEYHLASHDAFRDSMAEQPEGAEIRLSPQGRKLLEGHIKETMALLYLERERSNINGLRDFGLENGGVEGLDVTPLDTGILEGAGVGEVGVVEGVGGEFQ